jgi:hypothetical protein
MAIEVVAESPRSSGVKYEAEPRSGGDPRMGREADSRVRGARGRERYENQEV